MVALELNLLVTVASGAMAGPSWPMPPVAFHLV